MARVEIRPHIAKMNVRGGTRTVQFDQDFVILIEDDYDEQGQPRTTKIVAGYCDTAPGSAFRPIVNGIPDSMLAQIKMALAERDAAKTGKSVSETYDRHVAKPPPILSDHEPERRTKEGTGDEYDDDGEE